VRRISRYLLGELLVPLVLWVALIFLLLVVLQFLKSTEVLLGSASTAWDMVRVLSFIAPHFLVLALPIGLLLGIVIGFGRLAEDGELTAFAALGVGPARLLALPLGLGLVLSGVVALIMTTAEPWGLAAVRTEVAELVKRNVVQDVKPGQFFEDIPRFTLYAAEVDGDGRWGNVLIHDEREGASPLLMLARSGQVLPGTGAGLQLQLASGEIHLPSPGSEAYTAVAFGSGELSVGVEESVGRRTRTAWPREERALHELWAEVDELHARGENTLQAREALHRRLGMALAPLAIALVGTPLAVRRREGARARAVLLALFSYVAYYVLLQLCSNLALRGQVPPPLAGQLPNLAFAAVGAVLAWRLVRRGTVS
jgi:lipopolysaccharide export system permease protein